MVGARNDLGEHHREAEPARSPQGVSELLDVSDDERLLPEPEVVRKVVRVQGLQRPRRRNSVDHFRRVFLGRERRGAWGGYSGAARQLVGLGLVEHGQHGLAAGLYGHVAELDEALTVPRDQLESVVAAGDDHSAARPRSRALSQRARTLLESPKAVNEARARE